MFIEPGYGPPRDFVEFERFPLGTEDEVDLELLANMHSDLVLHFVGGELARSFAARYCALYVPVEKRH